MQLAGFHFVIGIWDIISLLLPIGLIFVYKDTKRKHKKRMDRLDLIYGEKNKEQTPEQLKRAQAGEALLDEILETK